MLACVCVYEDPQWRFLKQVKKDLGLKAGELNELPVNCVLLCAFGCTAGCTVDAVGLTPGYM
jgi:hypothetical protein